MADQKITVTVDADLEDLIPGFMDNRRKDLEKLRAAMTEVDFAGVQSIGHSLKGVGGGYGFHGLSEIGAGLENAAKAKDQTSVAQLVGELSDYLARVDIVFE